MMIRKSKYTTESAVAAAIAVHGDKYDYSESVFTAGKKSTLSLRCYTHGPFTIIFNNHIHEKSGCIHCARKNRVMPKRGSYKNTPTEEETYAKYHEVHKHRYTYPPGAFVNSTTEHLMICQVHGPFMKQPLLHLRGHGCRECYLQTINKNKMSGEQDFLKKAHALHGDHFDYSRVVWHGFKKRVEIYCKTHDIWFWKEPYVHLRDKSGGCPACQRSKGELAIDAVLDRLGVEYIREFSFPGYKYEFDLYLPDYQLFIEFHGGQHYRTTNMHGGEEGLLVIRKRDAIKASMAKMVGAEMVVLDYDQYLKGTLEAAVEQLIKDRPKKPRDLPFYLDWLEHQERLKPKAPQISQPSPPPSLSP